MKRKSKREGLILGVWRNVLRPGDTLCNLATQAISRVPGVDWHLVLFASLTGSVIVPLPSSITSESASSTPGFYGDSLLSYTTSRDHGSGYWSVWLSGIGSRSWREFLVEEGKHEQCRIAARIPIYSDQMGCCYPTGRLGHVSLNGKETMPSLACRFRGLLGGLLPVRVHGLFSLL